MRAVPHTFEKQWKAWDAEVSLQTSSNAGIYDSLSFLAGRCILVTIHTASRDWIDSEECSPERPK